MLNREIVDLHNELEAHYGGQLAAFIKNEEVVGELLSLDYEEARILVHDEARQRVGGVPMGCFLVATRIEPNSKPLAGQEDTSLILLRVIGHSQLPDRISTDNWRYDAATRAMDYPETYDSEEHIDQWTLNQLRRAGLLCRVLGTFRYIGAGDNWHLAFGADVSNFYSGQGMKIYKPMGDALKHLINFSKPTGRPHSLAGQQVPVGRVRYAATEIQVSEERENVVVEIEPTDMIARRTALFGMSRSGKSNTIKVLSSAIFKIRESDPEKGRIGQLIFDMNGEYCNDNPQDEGCLRNISGEDVVTYGMFENPENDPDRRLIKLNFYGEELASADWENREDIQTALIPLITGKEIIDDHLRGTPSLPQYMSSFIEASIEPPTQWNYGARVRYRRNLTLYRSILRRAGFELPDRLDRAEIKGLFSKEFVQAMEKANDSGKYAKAINVLGKETTTWTELYDAMGELQEFITGGGRNNGDEAYREFNTHYENRTGGSGDSYADSTMRGLLLFVKWGGGITRIRELQEKHDPSVSNDYADEIVAELINGKLVIVDQSVGSPREIQQASERIMWSIFHNQVRAFTNPERDTTAEGGIIPPKDIIVYVEEAHTLIPAHDRELETVWARTAKEGSKFRIGLVYSTQEPSSILPNILKNTDNWFVAHLNNREETRKLNDYYDFADFADQIIRVPDTGYVRMRCLSNPYVVPVQIDEFKANVPD